MPESRPDGPRRNGRPHTKTRRLRRAVASCPFGARTFQVRPGAVCFKAGATPAPGQSRIVTPRTGDGIPHDGPIEHPTAQRAHLGREPRSTRALGNPAQTRAEARSAQRRPVDGAYDRPLRSGFVSEIGRNSRTRTTLSGGWLDPIYGGVWHLSNRCVRRIPAAGRDRAGLGRRGAGERARGRTQDVRSYGKYKMRPQCWHMRTRSW